MSNGDNFRKVITSFYFLSTATVGMWPSLSSPRTLMPQLHFTDVFVVANPVRPGGTGGQFWSAAVDTAGRPELVDAGLFNALYN